MEIRKVIIYITRDGAIHTSEQRARQHVKRQRRAQAESARTIERVLKVARAMPGTEVPVHESDEIDAAGVTPSFTTGTHKDRIVAAIKAGNKKTREIRAATGIKANVLYADLAKLRAEGVITATNRLPTTRGRKTAVRTGKAGKTAAK